MSEKMKLDETMLRAVWASTFGAMVAQGVVPGRSFDEIVKRAREYADDAVLALGRSEEETIVAEQDAFKEGDFLTTQYGMMCEVLAVSYDVGGNPDSLECDWGNKKPDTLKRVNSIGWKSTKESWPADLAPYVLRLTDRRPQSR